MPTTLSAQYQSAPRSRGAAAPLRALRRATGLGMLALAALLTLPAPAALAETRQTAQFDLVLRGLRAAVLTYSGVERGNGYAVTGRMESTGLLSMVRRVSFDARAQGGIRGPKLLPLRYEEEADTGKRQQSAVMVWSGGVPRVEKAEPQRPARPEDVDPSTQRGSVDPLTALYATLRDVPADRACTTNVMMFDGRRSSRLQLSSPVRTGERITCIGEYRRIAGFNDKEMAERQRFPFTLTYEPNGNGQVRVVEVTMETLYGRAVLRRR